MQNSKIEWTDHTVNFVIGCSKVSEECANCYAESLDWRYKWGGQSHWGKNAPRYQRLVSAPQECLRLNKKAAKAERVDKVFINSLSDTFEDRGDLEGARVALYEAITKCQNLIFLLLTKRPENVRRFVPSVWLSRWPGNCWIGTTTGTQKSADERIPELLTIPAEVRFLSVEPMLEPIDIEEHLDDQLDGGYVLGSAPIHWVICGGESGSKKRPFNCDWARSVRDQCRAASVAFFMKQVDKVQPIPADLMIREFPRICREMKLGGVAS
jgi:protein gp37